MAWPGLAWHGVLEKPRGEAGSSRQTNLWSSDGYILMHRACECVEFHGKGNETIDVTEVATHFEIDWGGRLAELLRLTWIASSTYRSV